MTCVGDPICDFCRYYNFNGDENGIYIDQGMCEHPDHPERREPFEGCDDFECDICSKEHGESVRPPQ